MVQEGKRARILITVDGVCKAGETGTIDEFPYKGTDEYAYIQFDKPSGTKNGYPFEVGREFELLGELKMPISSQLADLVKDALEMERRVQLLEEVVNRVRNDLRTGTTEYPSAWLKQAIGHYDARFP